MILQLFCGFLSILHLTSSMNKTRQACFGLEILYYCKSSGIEDICLKQELRNTTEKSNAAQTLTMTCNENERVKLHLVKHSVPKILMDYKNACYNDNQCKDVGGDSVDTTCSCCNVTEDIEKCSHSEKLKPHWIEACANTTTCSITVEQLTVNQSTETSCNASWKCDQSRKDRCKTRFVHVEYECSVPAHPSETVDSLITNTTLWIVVISVIGAVILILGIILIIISWQKKWCFEKKKPPDPATMPLNISNTNSTNGCSEQHPHTPTNDTSQNQAASDQKESSMPVTPDYSQRHNRLQSFNNEVWKRLRPNWPKKLDLVNAGFYYCGPEDKVQCFCCNIRVNNWEKDDIPDLLHRIDSKDCKFIREPFFLETTRLKTFTDKWDAYQNIISKEELAKAGMFYIGPDRSKTYGAVDRVQCAFCDLILKDWSDGDNAEAQHHCHAIRCPLLPNDQKSMEIHQDS